MRCIPPSSVQTPEKHELTQFRLRLRILSAKKGDKRGESIVATNQLPAHGDILLLLLLLILSDSESP